VHKGQYAIIQVKKHIVEGPFAEDWL